MAPQLSSKDSALLKASKQSIENLGFAIRAVNSVGSFAETTLKGLPAKVLVKLQKLTKPILLGVVKANLLTIQKNKTFQKPSNRTYKVIVTGSGTVSGFFGAVTGLGTAIFASEVALTTKSPRGGAK